MISILEMPDHLRDLEGYLVTICKTTKYQIQGVLILQPPIVFFFVFHLTSFILISSQVLNRSFSPRPDRNHPKGKYYVRFVKSVHRVYFLNVGGYLSVYQIIKELQQTQKTQKSSNLQNTNFDKITKKT